MSRHCVDYLPNVTETARIDDTFGLAGVLMDRLIANDGIAEGSSTSVHACSTTSVC